MLLISKIKLCYCTIAFISCYVTKFCTTFWKQHYWILIWSKQSYTVQNKKLLKSASIKWYNSTETMELWVKQNMPKVGGRQILEKMLYVISNTRKGESLCMCSYRKVNNVCMLLNVVVNTSCASIWKLLLCKYTSWYHNFGSW